MRYCDVPLCGMKHAARGLCKPHYDSRLRKGEIGVVQPRQKVRQTCRFKPCPNLSVAYGLCQGHRRQEKLGRELTPLRKRRNRLYDAEPCPYPGCIRKAEAKGECLAHYQQRRAGNGMRPLASDFMDPEDPLTWNTSINKGYVYRYARIKGESYFIAEHRAVMEKLIGRKLRDEETVHHKNGVRGDNRAENLELWSHSHPYGQRVEDKVLWAEEILSRYSPTSLTTGTIEKYFPKQEED